MPDEVPKMCFPQPSPSGKHSARRKSSASDDPDPGPGRLHVDPLVSDRRCIDPEIEVSVFTETGGWGSEALAQEPKLPAEGRSSAPLEEHMILTAGVVCDRNCRPVVDSNQET